MTLFGTRLARRSLLLTSALTLLPAIPAWTADADDVLEEIVVTAERRSERLQDVPVAVTAFDADRLEARGVQGLGDISALVPSLEIHSTSRPGGGGSSIAAYIRGVGTGDYNIPTDPAIGIYVDGVYLARSVGGLLSLTDIEQVQVLNGPQGTLYGRNTLGGAILVTTRQPLTSGDGESRVGLRLGSDKRRDAWFSVNAPLVEDRVGLKLSASTLNADGPARQVLTGRRLGDEHRDILHGALRFDLADDLALTVNGDYTRQRQNPPMVMGLSLTAPPARLAQYNSLVAPSVNARLGLPAGSVLDARWLSPDAETSYSTSAARDDSDIGGASAKFSFTPTPALEVNAITAWRKLKARIAVSSDATPYNVFDASNLFRDRQFSQELTAGGTLLDGRLNYLAGGYYFREHGKTQDLAQIFHGLYEAGGGAANALDTLTLQDMVAESYAVFTQETLALAPGLNLTAGARLNHDRKDYTGTVLRPQLGTVGVPEQAQDAGWTSFTPKVSLDWRPSDAVMLYGSYAEGFKSGGVTTPILGFAPSSYKPETLKTVELGMKSTLLDRRLLVNAAGYVSRYNDVQLTSIVALPGGGSGRPTQNAGNAHIKGVELDITAMPLRGLTLNAGGGYVHARFSSLLPGAVAALGAQVGDRLPQIPDFNLNAGAEYRFDAAGGSLTLRGDVKVTGRTQLTAGDPLSLRDSYALVNVGLTYEPEFADGLSLSLRGSNITDRRYLVFSSRSPSTGIRGAIPGAPAEWSASAQYRF